MSLRMIDFRCTKCDREWEEIRPHAALQIGSCTCGNAASPKIGAPAVHFKTRYSHVLGREYQSPRELDRHLAKDGSWIPTSGEAKVISDMTDAGIEPVMVKPVPNEAALERATTKAMDRAYSEGIDLNA